MKKTYNIDDAYAAYVEQYEKIETRLKAVGADPYWKMTKDNFETYLNNKIDSIKARGGRPSSKVKLAKTIANEYTYRSSAKEAKKIKDMLKSYSKNDIVGFVGKVYGSAMREVYGPGVIDIRVGFKGQPSIQGTNARIAQYPTSYATSIIFGIDEDIEIPQEYFDNINAKAKYNRTFKQLQKGLIDNKDVAFDIYYRPVDINVDVMSPGARDLFFRDITNEEIVNGSVYQERVNLTNSKNYVGLEGMMNAFDKINKFNHVKLQDLRGFKYKDILKMTGIEEVIDYAERIATEAGMDVEQTRRWISRYVFGSK